MAWRWSCEVSKPAAGHACSSLTRWSASQGRRFPRSTFSCAIGLTISVLRWDAGESGSRLDVGYGQWPRSPSDDRPIAFFQAGDRRFLCRGPVEARTGRSDRAHGRMARRAVSLSQHAGRSGWPRRCRMDHSHPCGRRGDRGQLARRSSAAQCLGSRPRFPA